MMYWEFVYTVQVVLNTSVAHLTATQHLLSDLCWVLTRKLSLAFPKSIHELSLRPIVKCEFDLQGSLRIWGGGSGREYFPWASNLFFSRKGAL